MVEDKSNAILKQIQETYIDTDLRLAMYHLDMAEVEEAEAEIQALKGDPQWAATEEEQKLVFRTVDKVLNRSRLKKGFLSFYQITSKVSVFLLVFVIGLGVAAFSVEAIRVPLIEWLVNVQEKFTEIHFSSEGTVDAEISFGYLPEGYDAELTYSSPDSNLCTYTISNDQLSSQIILISGDLNSSHSVDTENAEVTDITISGNNGMKIEKDNKIHIIWKDENSYYSLMGEVESSLLMDIAQGINRNG